MLWDNKVIPHAHAHRHAELPETRWDMVTDSTMARCANPMALDETE